MQKPIQYFLRTLAGAAVCALAMQAGWAQDVAPDNGAQTDGPARWYQEDVTPRAHFQTSKKEMGAAYKEALVECKKADRTVRTACMREAGAQFEQDLTNARQKTRLPHN